MWHKHKKNNWNSSEAFKPELNDGLLLLKALTAWKVSKYGVISGPKTGKCGLEITPYLDTFHAVYYLVKQQNAMVTGFPNKFRTVPNSLKIKHISNDFQKFLQ